MMGALAIGLCLTAGLLSAALILAVGVFALQIVAASLRGVPGAVVAASVPRGPLAVLVPAHDEESGIGATVAGLRAQLAPGDRLLVVADNCTDATAAVALSAGAEVVERTSELRGKGYALGFGMAHLALAPPQAVVIVDADCQLAPGALEVLVATMNRSGRPVQALYLMLAQEGAGLSRRIAAFAWRVRNQVRPAGWHRLGLPCQLMGTGMAFPWAMLHGAPIANGSIVEDMKLGIDLAVQGAAPVFCEAALVTSTFPDTAAATTTQRTRWEHGHLEMIFREVPAMVARSVLRADIRLFGLALDLAVPPLALLAGLLCADELLVVLAWAAGAPVRWLFAVSALPVVFALSVLVAWWTAGRDLVRFIELLSIPWYILAKIPLYVRFLVKRQKSWVRTDRK